MADDRVRGDISQHILPTSATMIGVCITVVGIVRLLEASAAVTTMIDDVMAVGSAVFLMAGLVSYMSLRATGKRARSLERLADVVFLLGLVLVVVAGFMLAWEIGQARH